MADYATLYESMMLFHWIFIINLYGSMNFCLLFTYLCRILQKLSFKLVCDRDKDATLRSSAASNVFFSIQNLTSMFETFFQTYLSPPILSSHDPFTRLPSHSSHLSSCCSFYLFSLFVLTYIGTKAE